MRNVAAVYLVLGLLPAIGSAAEPAPLDEDFLEYLAELDTAADNWTWFAAQDDADGKDASESAAQPPAKRQEKVKP